MATCTRCGGWYADNGYCTTCPGTWIPANGNGNANPGWTFQPYYPPQQVITVPLAIEAMNDYVGTEPFPTDALQVAGQNKGFATAKQKTELTPLKVVIGTKDIPEGATVYVRGELCAEGESRKVYEFDGKKVIFIPKREIKFIKRYDVQAIKDYFNGSYKVGVGG